MLVSLCTCISFCNLRLLLLRGQITISVSDCVSEKNEIWAHLRNHSLKKTSDTIIHDLK